MDIDNGDQPQPVHACPCPDDAVETLRPECTTHDGEIFDDVCQGLRTFHDRAYKAFAAHRLHAEQSSQSSNRLAAVERFEEIVGGRETRFEFLRDDIFC
ncbi:MAG: hypothetical protein KBA32_05590 [Propionivibrio sp.]|uniref:hypothetical protein n=1 Tax=Propionivibrio sp. TaxID=2212460 RepID=UPI001B53D53C|nr:hypothetical protein [Propionivibrio sp.]MBP7202657.1 hypothetical protein [Propionivibrio sp.]